MSTTEQPQDRPPQLSRQLVEGVLSRVIVDRETGNPIVTHEGELVWDDSGLEDEPERAASAEPINLPDLHQAIMDLLDHAQRALTREQIWGRPSPRNRLTPDERPFVRRVGQHTKTYRAISKAIDDLIVLGLAHEPLGKGKGVSITPNGRAYQRRHRER